MLIDGRKIAADMKAHLKQELADNNVRVGLAAILVGDNPASQTYVRLKEKAANQVGMQFDRIELPSDIAEDDLLAVIDDYNERTDIHGIIVQLPLPDHLNTQAVINRIDPKKDADGFHPQNTERFLEGTREHWPVMTRVVMRLIQETGVDLSGKQTCILANSPGVFAPPLAAALSDYAVTTNAYLPDDPEAKQSLADADIVIVAIGRAHAIKPKMLKPGCIVIDIGINNTADGITGDVDPAVDSVAAWRSPVPGGVGPVTVATLLQNTVDLAMQTTA